MAKHRVEIFLNDEEEKFVKWLAKHDSENSPEKVTIQDELRWLMELQLRETKELYEQGDYKCGY